MAQNQPTRWVGWVYFAGAMMMLVGGLEAIAGLVAIFKDDYYVVTEKSLLVLNYTAWGWIHLVLGVLILLAGLAVMSGQTWGRVIGVFLSILSILGNLAFISAYPIWSIIAITLNVFVIYALTVHGREAEG
jgi:hypothetical protein